MAIPVNSSCQSTQHQDGNVCYYTIPVSLILVVYNGHNQHSDEGGEDWVSGINQV